MKAVCHFEIMLDRFLYGLVLELVALCDKEKSACPPPIHTVKNALLGF